MKEYLIIFNPFSWHCYMTVKKDIIIDIFHDYDTAIAEQQQYNHMYRYKSPYGLLKNKYPDTEWTETLQGNFSVKIIDKL
jgi:hypothetical protein